LRRVLVPEMKIRFGEPSPPLCAIEDENLSITHVLRSRQLQTNLNHASLLRLDVEVTCEYQFDSPSLLASFPGSGLSRDGPKTKEFLIKIARAIDWLIHISGVSPELPAVLTFP